MNSGQQKRIESIVRSVLERPKGQREAFLQDECGDDQELLKEVRAFLQVRRETRAFAPDSIDAEPEAQTVTDIIGQVVDPYIGEEIDGYRIISRLGAGGMGVVYKVENVTLQRMEALKVVSPRLVDNPEVRDKFLGEAHALAKILHPNIVTVFNLRQSRLGYYITMEYAEGENLAEVLGRCRVLPWKEAVPLVRQLLAALEYAHGRGIIHRDIKPNNVMITREGEVKVLDFGLAKFFKESAMTTLVSGTLYYMSPEQIDGRDLGPRSDLFSVGMTMYELLSGRLPFNRNASEYSIYRAIKEEPFSHLSEAASDLKEPLPSGLADIVMKALEKHPDDRFESAAAMSDALDAFVERESSASPASPPPAGDTVAADATPGSPVVDRQPASAKSGIRTYGPAAAVLAVLALVFMVVLGRDDSGDNDAGSSAPAEPVAASLSVNSLPDGADVWVDGEDVGLVTPLEDFVFDESADSVRIELRKAGFLPVDTVLHFAGESRVSLYLQLPAVESYDRGQDPAPSLTSAESGNEAPPAANSRTGASGPARPAVETGRLTVDAPPASVVLVNDEAVTPGEAVELTAGSHIVRCGRMPFHAEQIVDVSAGGTRSIRCFFARSLAVVARVRDGSEIEANIMIDGETAGSTQSTQPPRRGPGSWNVTVSADGFRPVEGTVPVTIRPAFEQQEPVELGFTLVSDAPDEADRRETLARAARALRERLETAIVQDSWAELPEPVGNYYRRWFREDRRSYDIRNPGVLFEIDRMTVDNNQGLLPVTVNYDLVQRGRSQAFSDRVEAVWTISIADGTPRILSVVDGQ